MKGIAVVTIAILGAIVLFTGIVAVLLPLVTLNDQLVENLYQKYVVDNTELVTLTLVSSKYNSTHTYYRILAEHDAEGTLKFQQKLDFLAKEFGIPNGTRYDVNLFVPYNENNLIETKPLTFGSVEP
jgi:uncharacterized protein YwgA